MFYRWFRLTFNCIITNITTQMSSLCEQSLWSSPELNLIPPDPPWNPDPPSYNFVAMKLLLSDEEMPALLYGHYHCHSTICFYEHVIIIFSVCRATKLLDLCNIGCSYHCLCRLFKHVSYCTKLSFPYIKNLWCKISFNIAFNKSVFLMSAFLQVYYSFV